MSGHHQVKENEEMGESQPKTYTAEDLLSLSLSNVGAVSAYLSGIGPAQYAALVAELTRRAVALNMGPVAVRDAGEAPAEHVWRVASFIKAATCSPRMLPRSSEVDRLRGQNHDLHQAYVALARETGEQVKAAAQLTEAAAHIINNALVEDDDPRPQAPDDDSPFLKHPRYVRFDDLRGLVGGTHGLWATGQPAFFAIDLREQLCSYGCGQTPVTIACTPNLRMRCACSDHYPQLQGEVAAARHKAHKETGVDHRVVGPAAEIFIAVDRDPNPQAN